MKNYIVRHFWWTIEAFENYERHDELLAFSSREIAETYVKRVFDKLVELGDSVDGAFYSDGIAGCDIRGNKEDNTSREGERWEIVEIQVDDITNLGEIEL